MTRLCAIAALLFAGYALRAQTPAPTQTTSTDPSVAMGFSYTLPSDWTVVAIKPAKTETADQPTFIPPDTIKGTACIRVPLTAQHGSPSSVIVVVQLPFDCYGRPMTDQDLPDFGSGATEGFKENFDLIDPVFGLYTLGSHHLWIERAKGTVKGKPETQYTMEIACSLLVKGAACWMTMAADAPSLHAFENGSVTLDTDTPTPLVPADAFDKPPAS